MYHYTPLQHLLLGDGGGGEAEEEAEAADDQCQIVVGKPMDGAANMSGRLSGVQARISADYPKALYIHCFCHSLNLAVQDVSRNIELIRNTLDTVFELSKLIRYSSKRKALLEKTRHDFETHGLSLRPLSNAMDGL